MDTTSLPRSTRRAPLWVRRLVLLVIVALGSTILPATIAAAGPDAPEPVRRLEAESASRRVTLRWRPPVDAADHDIRSYRIRFRALIPAIPQASAGPVGPRVFGGDIISLSQAPWQVALLTPGRDGFNGQFCGGSVIHARWVLTAAHCVVGDDGTTLPQDLEIGEGITNLDLVRADQRIAVRRIIVNPDYPAARGQSDTDLALIELVRPVREATIIPLDGVVDVPFGTEGYVSGWGSVAADTGGGAPPDYPTELHGASVQILAGTGEACGLYGGGYDESKHLCAADAGIVDTCTGDSGGPLALVREGRWVLSGVTSFGNGCGRPNFPGIYAKVAPQVRWISRHIPELGWQVGRVPAGYRGAEVTGLTNAMTYRFVVAAVGGGRVGAPSVVDATPRR